MTLAAAGLTYGFCIRPMRRGQRSSATTAAQLHTAREELARLRNGETPLP
jgi:hypothetical protein